MKLKAIILVESYSLNHHLKDLVAELYANDIEPYYIYDRSKLRDFVFSQTGDQFFLFFDHQNYYYPISIIKQFILKNPNFSGILDANKDMLGFYPKDVARLECSKFLLKGYPFILNKNIKVFKDPIVDTPRIIMWTNKREPYFQLSLNSLFNSLKNSNGEMYPKIPITLVLNEPSENIRKLALNIHSMYRDTVDVLEVQPNSIFAGLAIALLWHKPKYFIGLEDDFILPNCSYRHYPSWPKIFVEKLNFFDYVGWSATMDNYPYALLPEEYYQKQLYTNEKRRQGIQWLYNEPILLMGQCFAMSLEFYIRCANIYKVLPIDQHFYKLASRGFCSPSLLGYHIGWNQQQDGYEHLDRNLKDRGWNCTYSVKNLITGQERRISPTDILKI